MSSQNQKYIAIDLKSFYASVECVERGLDPLTTNLVVADNRRTEKTICLAVSPPLKAYGISGRARLFEVVQKIKEVNQKRKYQSPNRVLLGASTNDQDLKAKPDLAVDYIVALPRMAYYMEYSKRIYQIYLKHIAPEDIHVYSIDEVMIAAGPYLKRYQMTAYELAKKLLQEIKTTTGITATAGIGTNLYLAKVAMDIRAKHIEPDGDGARVAELDEDTYRQKLWSHRPLTDFWRVGRAYAKKLEDQGLFTMGDIARCSLGQERDYYHEDLLYHLFGVNAELLIDHAWGWEPCTLKEIKAYRPQNKSLGSGQVLHRPYAYDQAKLVAHEMTDLLALELVDKRLVCKQVVLTVGYDIENIRRPEIMTHYKGPVVLDQYGRKLPKPAHGTINLRDYTSSARMMIGAVMDLFRQIVNPALLVRRLNITANYVEAEDGLSNRELFEQLDLFHDYDREQKEEAEIKKALAQEKKIQKAAIAIKKKYGKNALLKGINLAEGATARLRNRQIGGHRA